ncbi:Uncharacterized protein GBIM_02941 [Gryllus bimaculatus]|nr:Uncharacterized protein GBIM_02941 [Gryllus bimaculatus]
MWSSLRGSQLYGPCALAHLFRSVPPAAVRGGVRARAQALAQALLVGHGGRSGHPGAVGRAQVHAAPPGRSGRAERAAGASAGCVRSHGGIGAPALGPAPTPAASSTETVLEMDDEVVVLPSPTEGGPAPETPAAKGQGAAAAAARLVLDESDEELFCLGRSFGTQDYFGQRVLQVAQILRNLSFCEENVTVLARNRCFLRFLLLCAGSRWNALHQHGLEMLGNVAAEVLVEDPLADRLAAGLVATVTRGLASQDRMVVVACLEILNKLSQRDENEDVMLRYLDQKVYDQVCTYLTLHDIMLLIYTLECLYSLSSLGERACNSIVRVHGVMDTLVSLITVEAQSYGPKACILMRVVETVSGTPSAYAPPPHAAPVAPTPPPVMPLQSQGAMLMQARPATPVTPQRQLTPQRIMIGPPQPAVATPVTPVQTTQTYQQQQQHAASQAQHENEQFALAWLRATFEPAAGCRIEQAEMYKQYLTACSKVGRRGVIAPLHFPRCVRSVFGGCVGPNPQKAVAGGAGGDQPVANLSFYEGIKVRITPYSVPVATANLTPQPATAVRKTLHVVAKTVTPPPSASTPPPPAVTQPPPPIAEAAPTVDTSVPVIPAPASPILKAQLCAPPKPRETPKGDAKSQVLAHPHLSQALLGGGGGSQPPKEGGQAAGPCSTSLIKSLLATKVMPGAAESMGMPPAPAVCASDNQPSPPPTPPQQVTQRQQQQRLLQQQLQTQSQPQKDCISPPPVTQTSTPPIKTVVQTVPTAVVTTASTATSTNLPVVAKNRIGVVTKIPDARQKISRLNGARITLHTSGGETQTTGTVPTPIARVVENHLPASGVGGTALRGRREPPQPPPPPLAPLSSGSSSGGNAAHPRVTRLDIEDSDSTGNNSLASSSGIGGSRDCSGIGAGNVSSTDDGENSLTSFEGILLNGIPHSLDIDAASNDSSSKDSARSGTPQQKTSSTKSLMLADLLEKKVDKKEPPILNGALGKELRIGEKGLELVENHLEKVLKDTVPCNPQPKTFDVKDSAEVLKDVKDLKEVSDVVRTVGQSNKNSQEVSIPEVEKIAFKTVGTVTDESISAEHVKAVVTQQTQTIQATKRPAETDPIEEGLVDAKRIHLSSDTVINGTASPGPPTVIKKEEESSVGLECKDVVKTEINSAVSVIKSEGNPSVSIKSEVVVKTEPSAPPTVPKTEVATTACNTENTKEAPSSSGNYPSAANLYAALAASAVEGEVDLEVEQPARPPPPPPPPPATPASNIQLVPGGLRQVFLGQGVEGSSQQQQLIVAAPRQIIVSQGQLPSSQVLITAGGQITLQQNPNASAAAAAAGAIKAGPGHQAVPVLVQTSGTPPQQARLATVQAGQVVLSQSGSGQFILSQAPQGQVQLVASGSQGGQYIVSTSGGGQTHYVVAQPQTALVQGQTQTVLVAQTPQQQGTGTKTIIILQPQSSAAATHHQKVVVTPQGQPVVVTQVPRPILQSPAITNITPVLQPPALVPTSGASPAATNTSVGTSSVKTVSTTSNTPVSTAMVIRGHQPPPVSNTPASLPPNQQSRIITPNPAVTTSPSVGKPVARPVITTTATAVNIQNPGTANSPGPRPSTPQSTATTTSQHSSPNTRSMTAQVKQTPPRPMVVTRTQLAQQDEKMSPMMTRNTKSPVSSSQTSQQSTSHVHQKSGSAMPIVDTNLYLCEWRGCMRFLRSYEPHLASVALSNVESSRTIAQVLYDMNHQSGQR